MHLMFYLDEKNNRVYTLKVLSLRCLDLQFHKSFFSLENFQKVDPNGVPCISAHPARFSPDDKFSKERITCKKRFNILPTQRPGREY
eukprot:gene261-477_t